MTKKIRKLLDSSDYGDFLIGLNLYIPNNIITQYQFEKLLDLEGRTNHREWWIYSSGVGQKDDPTILWCNYSLTREPIIIHLTWKR